MKLLLIKIKNLFSSTSIFLFFIFFSIWIFLSGNLLALTQYPFPEIKNYKPSEYGGDPPTWGITQDKIGRLYFANSYGVIMYDGKFWQNVKLDGDVPARSIASDEKGNIIIGGVGNFGFLKSDEDGNLIYQSFNQYLENTNYNINDIVYETIPLKDGTIFFRMKNSLLFFKDRKFKSINIDNKTFGVSRYLNKSIYLELSNSGLFEIIDEKLVPVVGGDIFANKSISGIHLTKNKSLLVFTRSSGVYLQKGSIFAKIKNQEIDNISVIYRTFQLKENIGLATYEGIFIIDDELKLVTKINEETGLDGNNIRTIFIDKQGLFWAGLQSGISKINIDDNFKYLPIKDSKLNNLVHDVIVFNEKLYAATDVGLKKLSTNEDRKRDEFVSIAPEKLNSQIWSLEILDNKLFIGSKSGFGFLDQDDMYHNILNEKTNGRIVYEVKKSKIFPEKLIVNTDKGLIYLDKNNLKDSYTIFSKSIKQFVELENSNEVWITEYGENIYKIKLTKSDSFSKIKKKSEIYYIKSIPSEKNLLFNLNNELYLSNHHKIFSFNIFENKFIESDLFNKVPNIANKEILDVKLKNNNNYWITFTEDSYGKRKKEFYEINISNHDMIKLPFDKIEDYLYTEFHFLDNYTLMSGHKGLVLIDKNGINSAKNYSDSLISRININNSSIYNHGIQQDFFDEIFQIKKEFSHNENKVSFSIALPDYLNEEKNKFRYKLEGFEKDFSDFERETRITYTNLAPGSYNFLVQGMNSLGLVSSINNYEFNINKPWWQSTTFYIIQFIIIATFLFLTLFLRRSSKASRIATAFTFMIILGLFELLNILIDPYLENISNGVPIFSITSKVFLGLLLLPIEKYISRLLNNISPMS